jgi:hypothetical protein
MEETSVKKVAIVWLAFDAEDGGDIFLRNVVWL